MIKLVTVTAVAVCLTTGRLPAADAKAIYDNECTECYGVEGKGETKMGPKLGAKDDTDPKVQSALTDAAAFQAMKAGFKDQAGKIWMKPTGGVSDADIKAVVAYLWTFKK